MLQGPVIDQRDCQAGKHTGGPGIPGLEVVGLDGRNLALPHGTGVATYAVMLARCLVTMGVRPEVLMAATGRLRPLRWAAAALPWPGWSRRAPRPSPEGWAVRTAPDLFRTAQAHFDIWGRLYPVAGWQAPDAMHWTYPLPLRFVGRPNIYTVHDLIPLLHPTLTPIDAGRARRMLRRIAAAADHLVTVSEAARREVIDVLGIPPERVTNTWQMVDVTEAAALPAGLPPGGYWLHVGIVERRKNLGRLIAAWRASGTPYPLVLAGPDGWNAAEEMARAGPFLVPEGAPLPPGRPAILRLPWLDRPQLLAVIRDARGLLMPSLAEGFGLPVAEAMALGTPVLTSDRGALAEVAGHAAVLADPEDGQALVEALRALDADAGLRAKLGAAGLVRARLFSPEAYASRLLALYRTVKARPHLR